MQLTVAARTARHAGSRNDVLKMRDYEMCEGESFYDRCEFYVAKP